MAKSNNSSAQVSYIEQATAGVIPATPAWSRLRSTGENLQVKQEFEESDELDPNDGLADVIPVSREAAGDVKIEFSDGTYDALLANLLSAPWTADVLVNDKIPTLMAVETRFETGAVDIFKRFVDCRVNKLALEMKSKAKITGEFGIIGLSADYYNAEFTGSTYDVPNTERVMSAQRDFGSFSMLGIVVDCIPMLTMEINRNIETLHCMNGSLDAHDSADGAFEAGGDIEFYLDADKYAVLRAAIDNTETSLEFTLGSVTLKKTKFEFPRVKFSGVEVSAPSKKGQVMIKCKWSALRTSNLTATTLLPWTVRITRNIA